MATKKSKKMIVFGILGAVIAFLFYRKAIHPPIATLQNATWIQGGDPPYQGSILKISYNPDGTVNIGDGYVGKYWFGKITTTTRNGNPNGPLVWQMQ